VQDPEEEDGPFDNGLGTLSDWRTRLLQSDSEDDENATASKGPQAAGKGSNQAGARLSPPAPSHASTVAGVVASSPADDSNLEQPSFDSSMNISMSSSRSANQALTTPPTSPGSSPVHLPPSALGKPLLLRDITPDEDRPFAARATQQANKVSKANKTARVKQASSASSVLPTKLKVRQPRNWQFLYISHISSETNEEGGRGDQARDRSDFVRFAQLMHLRRHVVSHNLSRSACSFTSPREGIQAFPQRLGCKAEVRPVVPACVHLHD